jgi:hypothetical protein
MPAEGIMLEGEALYQPGPQGRVVWDYWLDLWETVGSRVEQAGARLSVLLNGDLVDGRTFKNQELVSVSIGDQVRIAYEVMRPMMALKPESVYVTRGTPSHVGVFAEAEQGLANMIGAKRDARTGTRTAYNWLLRSHGRLIWATHHPPSAGRLVRTRKSQASLAANEVASRFWERRGADGNPLRPPDIAIFSHKHEPEDSGPVMPNRTGTRAIYLGPWQGKTQYAEKVASVALGLECHACLIEIPPEPWRQVQVDHIVYPRKLIMEEVEI